MAALGDETGEPVEGVLDHAVGDSERLLGWRLEEVGLGLEIAALHLLHLHAEGVEQLLELRPLEDHADRAGDGVAAGDDVVGSNGGDVAAGGGDGAHDRHDRLLGGDLADGLVDRLGPGSGAAGAVDVDDHGLNPIGFFQLFEHLEERPVAGDQAFDAHSRYVIGAALEAIPAHREDNRKDGEAGGQDGSDTPEAQRAPEPAPGGNGVSVEGHLFSPIRRIAADHSRPEASPLALALDRAAPRMSPSEAPESEEPYWATAAFSSAISSALIETWILRAPLSICITLASTFSPTAKRSGRCSERSRARSLRRMKDVTSVPAIFTSTPLS